MGGREGGDEIVADIVAILCVDILALWVAY